MKYKDSRLSCEVRAKDLLERMTLMEKVGRDWGSLWTIPGRSLVCQKL